MQSDSPYSPVLWGAIFIPVISGAELFIDPEALDSYEPFVLGFFYLTSIRYTLAVGLGVYSHEDSLKKLRTKRLGALLWISYFMVLILCSLLVPGAAIFGLISTVLITLSILFFSISQGLISLKSFTGKQKSDSIWRLIVDLLLLVLLMSEVFFKATPSFQSAFFLIIALILADFTISDLAKETLKHMYQSLKAYLKDSWNKNEQEKAT